jgi:hypothetical protein
MNHEPANRLLSPLGGGPMMLLVRRDFTYGVLAQEYAVRPIGCLI